MMHPPFTFVTCLFDLSDWDGDLPTGTHRRRMIEGEDGYLHLARRLLAPASPLVIFTGELSARIASPPSGLLTR